MDAPLRQIFATQSTRWPVKFVLRLAWKPAQTFRATFPWLFLGNSGRNQRFPCVRNSPLVPRNTFLWTAKWHPSSVAMHQPILPRTTWYHRSCYRQLVKLTPTTVVLESALVSLRSRDCHHIAPIFNP